MELETVHISTENRDMTAQSLILSTFASFAGLLISISASAQNKKLDLDDLMIKGELHSDDRLMILSRQKNELKNFIKFRTNYREEILEQLPKPQPKKKF